MFTLALSLVYSVFDPADVRAVRALGDGRFVVREDASQSLARSPVALPLVWLATRSPDPEVRCRSRAILRGWYEARVIVPARENAERIWQMAVPGPLPVGGGQRRMPAGRD